MYNIIIIVSVLLNAAAQIFLKKGALPLGQLAQHVRPLLAIKTLCNLPMLVGFGCYAASIFLWIYALSKVEVSYAYSFQSLGYILVTLAAYFVFQESITVTKIIGILLITAGVICVARAAG